VPTFDCLRTKKRRRVPACLGSPERFGAAECVVWHRRRFFEANVTSNRSCKRKYASAVTLMPMRNHAISEKCHATKLLV
jgi:hypothetical protein